MSANHGSFVWSQEAVDYLTKNYGKVPTREMGAHLGVSKNVIIGKAYRLGLQQGNPAKAYTATPRVIGLPKPIIVKAKAEKPITEGFAMRKVPFVERGRLQCAYILGEPTEDAICCGNDVRPGSVYCAGHHARCWIPAPPKAKKRTGYDYAASRLQEAERIRLGA